MPSTQSLTLPILGLALLVFASACQPDPNSRPLPGGLKDPDSAVEPPPLKREKAVLTADSVTIRGKTFIARGSEKYSVMLMSAAGDTLLQSNQGVHSFRFQDFDLDGHPDLICDMVTNVPGISEVALYRSDSASFSWVEELSWYPNSTPLKMKNLWYSYAGNGCADADWESILFRLQQGKVTPLGIIRGIGCENSGKTGIFIYRMEEGKEVLVKSIEREPGYDEGKRDFIDSYWAENYARFCVSGDQSPI